MNMLRKALIIITAIVLIVTLAVVALTINHQIRLKREAKSDQPPGQMVDIDGKKMHIYIEGEGDHTFVFMSGHGTSSPLVDFKPLWSKLAANNRIVVIEKFGYGFSESGTNKKGIDDLLEHTREALSTLEMAGPFVLVPHSLSGLEAIYWAQKYPNEVKAMIGLDACTPETIGLLSIPSKAQLNLVYLVSRIGLSRLMPDKELKRILPLLDSDEMTEEDKAIYKSMFFRSSLTKDMLAELETMNENARHVADERVPDEIPMFFFISSKQNEDVPGWTQATTGYLDSIDLQQSMILDTSHYVHHEMSYTIYKETIDFLEAITDF
jgi:pimeloyl-ACP methyl ester carboxylesterase